MAFINNNNNNYPPSPKSRPSSITAVPSEVVVTYIDITNKDVSIDKDWQMVSLERCGRDQVSKMNIKQALRGIVVVNDRIEPDKRKPDTIRQYISYIIKKEDGEDKRTKEARSIKFWFDINLPLTNNEKLDKADDLFDDLLDPKTFPKNYEIYILRMAKLLIKYTEFTKLELEWRQAVDYEIDEAAFSTTTQNPNQMFMDETGNLRSAGGQLLSKSDKNNPSASGAAAAIDHLQTTINSSLDLSVDENITSGAYLSLQAGSKLNSDKKRILSKKGFELLNLVNRYQVVKILEDAFPNSVTIDRVASLCAPFSSNQDQYNRNLSKWRIRAKVTMDALRRKGILLEIGGKNSGVYIRAVNMAAPPEEDGAAAGGLTSQDNANKESGASGGGGGVDNDDDKNTAAVKSSTSASNLKRHQSFKPKAFAVGELELGGEIYHVTNIPQLASNEQPTAAVVTLLYEEKMAIDALLAEKKTYVRAKTKGEGQVYTIGKVGRLRVVTTKLSRITGKGAIVAAGNTITRLLGTFTKLEHVLIIGIGGSICDESGHPKEGDVVISRCNFPNGPLYSHVSDYDAEEDAYKQRSWHAANTELSNLAESVVDSSKLEKYVDDLIGFFDSRRETRFYKPSQAATPQVCYGLIGSGKLLQRNRDLLLDYTNRFQLKALDAGFGAVFESLDGSRHESFLIIRGISDTCSGNRNNEWQQYAAVLAACYARLVLEKLQPKFNSPVRKTPKKLYEFDTKQQQQRNSPPPTTPRKATYI